MSIQTEFSVPEGVKPAVVFTLRDAVRLLFKHGLMVLVAGLLGTLALVLANLQTPPNYSVDTKLLIHTELKTTPDFFSGISVTRESSSSLPANRILETDIELLQSRPIFEKVVKDFGVTYDQVYHPGYVYLLNPVADVWDAVMDFFGFPVDPEKRGFADTVRALQKSISVHQQTSSSADTNSNIIEVRLKITDPQIAAPLLNAIIQGYLRFDLGVAKESARQARSILETQVEVARDRADQARQSLSDYLIQTGSEYAFSDAGEATQETVVDRLRLHLTEMELDLVGLQQIYRSDEENVVDLQNSIELIKQRIGEEMGKQAVQGSEVTRVRQKMMLADTAYERLINKLAATDLYINMLQNKIPDRVVIAGALPPRESSWKKDLLLMMAGVFGVWFFAIALAGFREYLDHTFYTDESVGLYLGLPVLAVIPLLDSESVQGQFGGENE